MRLEELIREKKLSIYRCAELSNVPYTTMRELVKGKTNIEKCTVGTIYNLAKTLDVSVDFLIEQYMLPKRVSFETFKSQICHTVKNKGDIDFIIDELQADNISKYWDAEWYEEAFYLLAMVDYLSRENDLPICTKYNDIRSCKLDEPIFPRDINIAVKLKSSLDIRNECIRESIPEFIRFNIVEREVRNVF